MNYPEDPKTQIEMQLHEQYAINSNAILGSMLTLFVALLAVIGTYGYVFLRTESFQCVSCAEFTLADLRYTATASIFVLAIIAWLSITAGYRQRKEQFITDAIRKQYYTKEEFNKIYPQGYEPINKKWLIKPMTFPYGTFFWISVFTSVTIILSLFLKSKPGIYEEKAGKVLITSIIIVVFFIGVKLFLAHRMYKKYERNHKDKLLFIGEKVNSKEKKHCNIIKIKFMKHLNSITAKVKGLFSKFFAVLALMLVTVGAYGTTYTDKAKSTYRSSSIDLTDKKVTVTMMRNGTYKFVLSSVQINGYSGVLTLADFTINGVTGKDNDDGSVSYSYSGNATTTNCSESILYGFTEGGTMAVEMTGTSRNGKLYMMLTISTVSTVYTFGEEITINKMVTYTANATSSTNSGTTLTAHKNKVVKVVETDNGIYKFVMEDVELCAENNSTLTIGDFEINGVKGTIDSEGYVNYSFDGNAITTNVSSSDYFESLSEGGKLAVTLEGKSKDGELYFVLKSELRRFTSYSCSTLYRFYDTGYYVYSFNDPVVEGDVIGTDGYKSTGSTFNNSFSINLSSQKFVAHIDLYTCKNDNENVLSIGSSTSSSDSNAGNIHLYYSPSTKTLLCQYVYATNKYTAKLTDIEESMTVELSEVYGLLVNGTEAFNPSLLTPLFEWSGPNPLLCGSYGGSAKSNATYKFFRKKDLPYSPSTYTANAQEVYDGVTLDLKNQTVRIVQTAEDTYTVIYSNVILGTTKIGNLTAKGVKGTSEFDGYVVYSFDGNAVISNVDTTNVVLAAYGIKNGATLPFKIEGRSFDGVLKAKFTATFNKKDGEIFFNGYSGTASLTTENYIGYVTWSFSSPAIFPAGNYRLFDQTVKITKADDGTYTVVYKNCCELGDFTAKGVKGTTDADGNTSYSFTGKATLTNVSERAVSRYSLAEGQEMAFIMKGSSNLNGELEAEFSTSLKNSPLIINYTPFKTYIADAAINSGDSVYNATDQIVKIAKTAENTYIVLYKDLTIGSKNIGDFTFSDVTGTPDADGNIYYSCVSDNCDTFVGSSKNGKLVAKFAINGYGEISYNGFAETSTDTYTANVVRYNSYNGSLYVDKTQTVSITANNAGSYKFVYLLYTIDGVTKTKNSDGCESFVFNGKGKYYSYVKSVSLEATRQDGIVHMALNEEIYFGADSYNFDATSTYNGNAVELTDQKLIIAKTANDTYKFIYKDLTLGSNKIGHFTASGVKGTTDADGNLNFSYNGNATVTNVNSELSDYITEGGTLPFKIEGKLVNGSLIAKFTITYNGSEGIIRCGSYVYAGNAKSIFDGIAVDLNSQTVTIREAAEDTYTIVCKDFAVGLYRTDGIIYSLSPRIVNSKIGDFTVTGVKGTKDAEGYINYSFNGNATVTNVSSSFSDYIAEGGTLPFKIEGKSKDGSLVATFKTLFKDSECVIRFGYIYDAYTGNAKSTYGETSADLTNQTVEMTETGENTYLVIYKDLTLGSDRIGDFIVDGVKGTKDAEGYINYSFNGSATVTNVNSSLSEHITGGDTLPFKMEGKSKEDSFVATFTTTFKDSEGVIRFGYSHTYTANAKTTFYNPFSDISNQTVEITEMGNDTYTVVYKGLVVEDCSSGDFTAEGVKGTKDAEGYINYSFDGNAKTTNFPWWSILAEGGSLPLKMIGKSKEGSLVAKFITKIDNKTGVVLYNGYKDATYTANAKSTYDGNAVDLTGQIVEVTEMDNDTSIVVYKDLSLGTTRIGDVNFGSVTVTKDAGGYINYSFEGEATVTNVNSELSDYITEGGTLPFKIEGKLVNGSLIAKFTITYNGSEGVIRYNGYDETYEPTVIITAKNATREYGDANPTLEYEVTGGTLDGVPELECTAAQSSPVGTYVITVKSGTVKNSNVTYVDGTLTVTKAPLVISAGTYSKKQGEVMPTFEASYSGFKNSETEEVLTKQPELTTTATETSEPGEYEVTVSGAEAENYSITYESGKLVVSASDPEPDPEPEERTDGTVVGTDGYQPAGESFVWNASIDWETQRLVASIDVSGCTGKYENLLSVGDKIEDWCGNHVHIYYTRNDAGTGGNVLVYYMNAIDAISCATFDMDGDDLRIIISKKKGITVNGKSFNYKFADYFTNGGDPITDTSGFYAALWALSDIQVGSQEGGTRSNATYNYIRVQDLVSPTEPDPEPDPEPEERKDGTVIGTDGYQPAGASFVWNASIDWETQKLVASIDVSTCLSSTTCENILSVGSDISSWADGEKFHIYYTQSSKTLTIWYIDNWEYKIQHKEVSVSDDVLRVEISKEKGLVVNGEDFNDGNDVATTYEELWKLSDIQVGSQEGVNRSNATYNYIRVQDLIKPDVPTAINAAALNGEADIYTLSGVKVNELQKGINIVRMNGKTMKIVKR